MTFGADIDEDKPVLAFRGEIDDLRVYNRALARAEFMDLAELRESP